MNVKLIITVAILIGSFNANAQTSSSTKARIAEIKKWYAEIQTIGLKNCKSKNYIKSEGLSAETPKFTFDQKIQVCQINENYQITKCNFSGYEWSEDFIIYTKNKKIFFVFISGVSENYYYERRYYCNQDEKIIQQLEREGEGEEALKSQNKVVNTNLNKSIKFVFGEIFTEINREFYNK